MDLIVRQIQKNKLEIRFPEPVGIAIINSWVGYFIYLHMINAFAIETKMGKEVLNGMILDLILEVEKEEPCWVLRYRKEPEICEIGKMNFRNCSVQFIIGKMKRS